MKWFGIFLLLLVLGIVFWSAGEDKVDFNTQVRPILNQKCLVCHGGVRQNGGLGLRFENEANEGGDSGRPAIVPGKPNKSELIKRIKHPNHDYRMPFEGEPLSKTEIRTLEKWIKQGAQWETHWAYIKPDPTLAPPAIQSDWIQNPIDQFVLQKLKSEELSPSLNAEKGTLLRRLYLDLTGIPPSIDELNAFLLDESDDAYESIVDKLLTSPHFGEKWAALWLDLARYADSQGYQKDMIRPDIWRYRDWVIDALNADMPFDQFTIEQLAGDLLPDPTDNQLLATAFHRNTMTNDEGGTDDEEFRVAAVIDRVNTTFEIWQASTIACVQCHSHPYDPFQHEEYYELYSFFNNTADRDLTNEYPVRFLASPNQHTRQKELTKLIETFRTNADTVSSAYADAIRAFASIKAGPVPIMQELPSDSSRSSFVFERGNWLVHGQEVKPGVPDFMHSMNSETDVNRLDLAHWLISPENPLTSRVMVNRFWEQIFGIGLVETTEDFGTQGAAPSHPDLLDWLAVQFQDEWSIKSVLKTMVMSNTYRQTSNSSAILTEKDPYNRLLARGPRLRLSSEQIRDQALSASGLLSPTVYGPSVMPYQPDGVWNVIRHTSQWTQSEGENQYRRALYTFWRRVSPYPSMELFDSPSRELCTSRRVRTNTPLQALVMMNDPVYAEAARHLAKRLTHPQGQKISDRISRGYKILTMKDIDPQRLKELIAFYDRSKAELSNETLQPSGDTIEFQALTQIASVLLNLDEVIMKT